MGNWAAYQQIESMLDDIRRRFSDAEREHKSCSLNISNATGVYTILIDNCDTEDSD